MSILHADNFSIYGTTVGLMLNGIYSQNDGCALVADPDGVSGGHVLRPGWNGLDNTNTNWRYPFQSGPAAVAGAAFRMWNSTLPNDASLASTIMEWRNNANHAIASFGVLPTGALRLQIGVINIDTDVPRVTATGWYHTEIRLESLGVNSTKYEIRVEGITVLQGTEATQPSGNFSQLAAFHVEIGGHAQQYFIKDLVIWNGAGTENNDFLGSVLVTELALLSDIALNWTPSAGTNGFSILDNIPPNDAIYLAAPASAAIPPTFPAPYVASLSDLPVSATSVKAVITFVRAAKSDGGDGSLQVGLISDPTGAPATVLGANRPITVAQTYWRDVFEEDPKTNAPWAPGAVNSAYMQINRTS